MSCITARGQTGGVIVLQPLQPTDAFEQGRPSRLAVDEAPSVQAAPGAPRPVMPSGRATRPSLHLLVFAYDVLVPLFRRGRREAGRIQAALLDPRCGAAAQCAGPRRGAPLEKPFAPSPRQQQSRPVATSLMPLKVTMPFLCAHLLQYSPSAHLPTSHIHRSSSSSIRRHP